MKPMKAIRRNKSESLDFHLGTGVETEVKFLI